MELTSEPCLSFNSTAHSLSTCSSLARCGTWKRLMSIETFRRDQITDRHYTDISRGDKPHAHCRRTTGGRYSCCSTSGIACTWCTYMFSTWRDTIFNYYFQKREKTVLPQVLGILTLTGVGTRYLYHLFLLQVIRNLLKFIK